MYKIVDCSFEVDRKVLRTLILKSDKHQKSIKVVKTHTRTNQKRLSSNSEHKREREVHRRKYVRLQSTRRCANRSINTFRDSWCFHKQSLSRPIDTSPPRIILLDTHEITKDSALSPVQAGKTRTGEVRLTPAARPKRRAFQIEKTKE